MFTKERPAEDLRRPAPPPDLTDDQPPAAPRDSSAARPVVTTRGSRPPARPPTGASGGPMPEVPDSQFTDAGTGGDARGMSPEAEKAFKRVESAYYNPDPAKALLAFDAFAEEFPDVHKQEIAQYREDMLDKIWWERIDGLFEKRKKLTEDIKKTEGDIKVETEAAFKKTVLEPRLADQKARLTKVGERLTKEMGYTLATPPKIGHDKEMRELRAKRDAKIYDEWKDAVLTHVRSTRGQYPWANER
jgi:hypothetical protein